MDRTAACLQAVVKGEEHAIPGHIHFVKSKSIISAPIKITEYVISKLTATESLTILVV